MTTRCEDVTDRLMELLYQELPDAERATLEAHVSGCERCRAELASFHRTRSLARAALDGPAPASVRQRLVAAAVLEAAARRGPGAQAIAPAAATDGGRWQKLRARWTFPTLATVGAMAVFLLGSRVFLNPEATVERGRRVAQQRGAPTTAGEAPTALAPAAGPIVVPMAGTPAWPVAANKVPADHELREEQHARARPRVHVAASSSVPLPAPAAASAPEVAPADRDSSTLAKRGLSGKVPSGGGASGVARGEVAAPRKPSPFPGVMDNPLEGLSSGPSSRPSSAQAAAGRGEANQASAARAAPAPPAITVAPAAQGPSDKAERERVIRKLSLSDSPDEESARAQSSPAPVAAEPRLLVERSAAAPREDRVAAPRMKKKAQLESESAARAGTTAASAEPAESVEVMAQRAERLFNEGRWSEAATAFERLLRQHPRSPQAPAWRKRLAAAQQELRATEMMP